MFPGKCITFNVQHIKLVVQIGDLDYVALMQLGLYIANKNSLIRLLSLKTSCFPVPLI